MNRFLLKALVIALIVAGTCLVPVSILLTSVVHAIAMTFILHVLK